VADTIAPYPWGRAPILTLQGKTGRSYEVKTSPIAGFDLRKAPVRPTITSKIVSVIFLTKLLAMQPAHATNTYKAHKTRLRLPLPGSEMHTRDPRKSMSGAPRGCAYNALSHPTCDIRANPTPLNIISSHDLYPITGSLCAKQTYKTHRHNQMLPTSPTCLPTCTIDTAGSSALCTARSSSNKTSRLHIGN
jgi:hypothetical protein